MQYDFMKFWRPVRIWILREYKLKNSELDMLLFLYSEDWFTRGDFDLIGEIMSWDRKIFDEVMNKGFVMKVKEHVPYRSKARYALTQHAKGIVAHMYRKLTGEETMKRFNGDEYSVKYYNLMRERMVSTQELRPAPESRNKRHRLPKSDGRRSYRHTKEGLPSKRGGTQSPPPEQ